MSASSPSGTYFLILLSAIAIIHQVAVTNAILGDPLTAAATSTGFPSTLMLPAAEFPQLQLQLPLKLARPHKDTEFNSEESGVHVPPTVRRRTAANAPVLTPQPAIENRLDFGWHDRENSLPVHRIAT